MTDVAVPPCDQDAPSSLPAVGDRVRHVTPTGPVAPGHYGWVHGVDPAHGTVLVLRDGAFFAETYPASDWEVVS